MDKIFTSWKWQWAFLGFNLFAVTINILSANMFGLVLSIVAVILMVATLAMHWETDRRNRGRGSGNP